MNKSIEIPQTLYDRLATHSKGFDTPASVIERLVDFYEQHNEPSGATPTTPSHASGTSNSTSPVVREYGKLQVDFFPPDLRQFNELPDATPATPQHASGTNTSTKPIVREYGKLQIDFFPPDLRQFKAFLLRSKQAWVLLHRSDGSKDLHLWNASRFTEKSDVLGNLRSGYLRGWRDKGIVKAEIAIEKSELSAI